MVNRTAPTRYHSLKALNMSQIAAGQSWVAAVIEEWQ
jgi:hypothetical protein